MGGRILPCAQGTNYRHYRPKRGRQDHPGPVSVRFDEGTKRYNFLGWKASEPNGKKAEGVPDHAGCEPPAFWRQRAGRDPAGKYGHRAGGFDNLGPNGSGSVCGYSPHGSTRGQKQRLAVADGCFSGKELLIFDEPTSGLDYGHMLEVSRRLRELAEPGLCVVVITHDGEFLRESGAWTADWLPNDKQR